MPSVTYNGQSFAIDGKRLWILGASIQYARVPAAFWPARIAAARQAGFNTIETACPWFVHEPRRGRFDFQGQADVRKFIEACWSQGMRIILRVGPYVGSDFDGGGLPGWLLDTPGIQVREANDAFLELVSSYFRKLLGEVVDLQATSAGRSGGGPVLLVQSEHAWTCSNQEVADEYLAEVTRFIRESGITVPIINANDLWQDSPETIDTWRGYDDLLVHLRQLRTVQPNAPRLVSAFNPAQTETWGGHGKRRRADVKLSDDVKSPHDVLRRLAEILASGAQPVVSPFHGGTNFGFMGGRVSGMRHGFVATSAAHGAPLGESGDRTTKYHVLRRLITFANHFGHVFAELDPDYHPIVLDPALEEARSGSGGIVGASGGGGAGRHAAPARGVSIVPMRGPQGQIAFVFGDPSNDPVSLLLEGGIRLPVHLGEQGVGWFALDVDLHGSGRLDYASLCLWGIVARTIIVLQGPAKTSGFLSISGTPIDVTVPAGGAGTAPFVIEHKGLTVVVCNHAQIDAAYHNETSLYVGIAGFGIDGAPIAHPDFPRAWIISKQASVQEVDYHDGGKGRKSGHKPIGPRQQAIRLTDWHIADAASYVTGQSPRFASLEGPETLSACGAPSGYGWYRVRLNQTGRLMCGLPHAADRVHVYHQGKRQTVFGAGPGASFEPFELRSAKGEAQMVVALVDNFGRFADGNDLLQRKGLFDQLYLVKPFRTAKPKVQAAKPVDPFELRGFIAGASKGQLSDAQQVVWTFNHAKKTPIMIVIDGARPSGTFVLNDQPIAYYAGASGGCFDQIMLDPRKPDKALSRGKNVLRFAPDLRREGAAEEAGNAVEMFECIEPLSDDDGWAFAKWEPPSFGEFRPVGKGHRAHGLPCWWRASFHVAADLMTRQDDAFWIEIEGMSKGQVYLNGINLGRYFTATAEGKDVGPQTRLYAPPCWMKFDHPNEVLVFDEHGFDPARMRIVLNPD